MFSLLKNNFMGISVTCSNCSGNYNLKDDLEGKKVKCPKCKNIIEVIKDDIKKNDNHNVKSKSINKKLIIAFIVILFLGAGLGYAYKIGILSSSKDSILDNYIKKEVLDINYQIDFSGSLNSFNPTAIDNQFSTGSLSISDLKIYSNNKGLNQRISLGNISAKLDKNEILSGSNLDIISDNEKIYVSLEKGFDSILNILGQQGTNTGIINTAKNSFGSGQYVMIDNSLSVLKVFGELTKNPIIKDLIIGLSTSNPNEYLKKKGSDIKLKNYLASDRVLDYLFIDSEKDKLTSKIPITLNPNICKDYAPVILKIGQQIKSYKFLMNGYSSGSIVTECNKILSSANKFLPMFVQMYKEGDTDLGNFKLAIVSGNMVDVNISYKNHKIDTWYISAKAPNNMANIKINGNSNGILSSTIKVNYDKDGIKIKGDILDGSGSIDINGKQEGLFDIVGKINFKDYILTSYNIDGKMGIGGTSAEISANGTLNSGKIYLVSKQGAIENIKLDLSYEGKSYNLDFVSEQFKIKSDYKDSVFNLDITNFDYRGIEKFNIKVFYNNGKLDGEINIGNEKTIIKGHYNNLKDFNLNIKNNNYELSVKTQIKGLNEIQYIGLLKYNGVNMYDFNLNIKKDNSNGLESYNITGLNNIKQYSYDYDSLTGKMNTGAIYDYITSNFSIKIKKGGVKYEIPKNYKNLDVNINERLILPDYTSILRTSINKKTLFIGGTAGLAIGGTIGYISLQGYSADARNSKRTQDLNNLAGSINIKSTMGVPLQSFIIRNPKYEGKDLYIGGNKLVGGENYFVGTPNYTALGVRSEDFKDPNGEKYIIGVTTLNNGSFEILSFVENGDGSKTARITGNYNARKQNFLKKGKDYKIILDKIIKIGPKYIGKFYRGDIIEGNKILRISPDGSGITFENKFDKKMFFLRADSKGLISINNKIIQNGDSR